MSAFKIPGGIASDSANILVTVLGLVVILATLWLGNLLMATQTDSDASLGAAPPPPKAIAEAR